MTKKNKKVVENQTSKASTPWGETHADICDHLPNTILGDDIALVTENMEAILRSPSYSLAQDDRALLERTEMRGVRMLLELGKPELAFQEDNIESTIIVFGGTQIAEKNTAERRLSEANRNLAMDAENQNLAREVQRSEKLVELSHFYDDARQFARLVSIDNQCDKKRSYVVVTGGGPGIMEAANRGAFDVGCKSIGLNIKLPAEQQPNPFITPELCFQFKYFALRKFHFILRSVGAVLFPGGFGTLDEMFQTLTLRQTHRMQPIPIILFGHDYWSKVIDFDFLADSGVISHEHLDLFEYADTPESAWEKILQFNKNLRNNSAEENGT
ncbi:MAG: LOG family protein [Pirellulales bacterium]|jgi:uncharacterized protein (TIGR00730 family)